jgi:hypothetical protein
VGAVSPSYKGHRYPVEVISHCVWLYFRFPPGSTESPYWSAALRRQLGQQVDQIPTTDLIARVYELTSQNTRLSGELTAAQATKQQLEAELAEAQDDLGVLSRDVGDTRAGCLNR